MDKEAVHPKIFEETLTEELDRRGWSLFQLDREIGTLHFDDLCRLYCGLRGPTRQELEAICEALGVEEIRLTKTRAQIEAGYNKARRREAAMARESKSSLDKLQRELRSAQAALRLRDKYIKSLKEVSR